MSDDDIAFSTSSFSWYRRHRQPIAPPAAISADERKLEIKARLAVLRAKKEKKVQRFV